MMTGNVLHRHAMLPVIFRLPGRPDFTIELVVDTGLTGALALPSSAVAVLDHGSGM